MSVDELLMAVEDLNEPDLENLVNRALFYVLVAKPRC